MIPKKRVESCNLQIASCDFCHLPIIFANRLEVDQDRQYVGSDLGPICLTR